MVMVVSVSGNSIYLVAAAAAAELIVIVVSRQGANPSPDRRFPPPPDSRQTLATWNDLSLTRGIINSTCMVVVNASA